jgi:hypothetical protein
LIDQVAHGLTRPQIAGFLTPPHHPVERHEVVR